ncbi:MAG: ABC transporter ATP-binding protein [Bacteroidales bacterium]|nr:ABC transporter ATP-binding protein [Bacteroidales bacterium]
MATAIEFENIGKLYRLGLVGTGTLSHDLKRWWTTSIRRQPDPYLRIGEQNDRSVRGQSDYVWALKDIDFKVEQGDVVGIIGRNGAGKSTLLKILSRVTAPTTGTIRARGRIGSLLEVGTGFHPEMTGRENIYLNGAILGMTKEEITRKLDEIIDFSGCERYIDTPVKRYSSGMMVRLGFAVAAHLDPEILVVDEVLAVGDAEFQKKAIGKMQDISKGEGRTVLLVSHNMANIRSLCNRCVVLDKGVTTFVGDTGEAVAYYTQTFNIVKSQHVVVTDAMRDMGRTMAAKMISVSQVKESCTYASDEDIVLRIKIESSINISECRVNCTIDSSSDTPICTNSSVNFFDISAGETKEIEYTILNPGLTWGKYSVSFSVGTGNMTTGETNFDVVRNAIFFEIDRPSATSNTAYAKWNADSWGNIYLHTKQKIIS